MQFTKLYRLSTINIAIIALVFLVGAAVTVSITHYYMRQETLRDAHKEAELILRHNRAIHDYFTYELKPHLFATIDNTDERYAPSWMSSTYAVRMIFDRYRTKDNDRFIYKPAAINARTASYEADDYERSVIKRMETSPDIKTVAETLHFEGAPYYVVMTRGNDMEERCMRCHSTPERAPAGLIDNYGQTRGFGRRVGELSAAFTVRIPLAQAFAETDAFTTQLSIALTSVLGVMLMAIALINRKMILVPLHRLKTEAVSITEDETRLGQAIPVPQLLELKELTNAFNTMSGALSTSINESKRRYRNVFDAATDCFVIVTRDGMIKDANPAAHRTFGYEAGEMQGLSVHALAHETEHIDISLVSSKLDDDGTFLMEGVGATKDGTPVYVETTAARINYEGESHVLAVIRDITERKKAEDEIKTALTDTKWYARKMSALLAGSKAVNESNDFETAARKIFYTCSETIGSKAGYIALISKDGTHNEVVFLESGGRDCNVDPSLPMPLRGLRDEAVKTQIPQYHNDFKNSHWMSFMPDGHVTLDNVMFSPLSIQGKAVGVMGLANKPTDFNEDDAELAATFGELAAIALHNSRTMEELEKSESSHKEARLTAELANKSKTEFLANMSHEIRTPLNGIMGMLQLIQCSKLDTEQTDYVDTALNSSRHLLQILSDILDLSRIESGALTPANTSFDVRSVIQTVTGSFANEASNRKLILSSYVDDNVPAKLKGDPMRLRQVIFNIVGNSLKYTNSGEVRLEISALPFSPNPKSINLHFMVKDTGIGIPQSKLDTIFDDFTQVDGSYTREYGGVGLGLAIVRRIVRLLGGSLFIGSTPGEGTEVHLSMPFQQFSEPKQASPLGSATACPTAAKNRRILVVEDEKVNRLATTRLLQMLGYQTASATNGQEALTMIKKEDYCCILMDIQMPILDGVQTTKYIRNDVEFSDLKSIPIIALTAYAMTGDSQSFLDAGMDAYISKPVEITALSKTIEGLLSTPQ